MSRRWFCLIENDEGSLFDRRWFWTRRGAVRYGRDMASLPIGRLPGFKWSVRQAPR